ncbi:hypothetical protein [Deinococcus sp.]|uniref:hypothetical protein n=1 Tax=Deinococcus sp. TaxID=47478 RepID=UPI002869B913|nr:hypothetical protein [Deinococcus sp.]
MRRLALLLGLGLSACAYTPPQPPFANGDVFVLSGSTVDGHTFSQAFTVRGGAGQHDGRWQ